METFAEARPFVGHPEYSTDRRRILAGVNPEDIDPPIRDLVARFAELPQCFTLQCCYGHFVPGGLGDLHTLDPAPDHDVGEIQYRIAYLALCIENSEAGRHLRSQLRAVTEIDPDYVQFGSPDWFWERQVNSYALQVEPDRFKHRDWEVIDWREALHVQEVRATFWARIDEIVSTLER
jgi:hypothetical protein